MKPRTKLEKELQAVIDNVELTTLTPKQMQQAHQFMDSVKRCRLFGLNSEQTIRGMKLTKCYKVHRYGRGSAMTLYHLCLIKAEKDGEVAWAARSCGMGVVDSFSYEGNITIKDEHWWYEDYIKGNYTLRSVGKPYQYSVVRNFLQSQYEFRDSRIETIAKCGCEGLLREIMQRRKALSEHLFAAFKVANRHGYNIGGYASYWVDLVEMLKLNKMDYRNPVFICPKDMNETYQRLIDINDRRLLALRRAREAAEAEERERQEKLKAEEAAKFNETYIKEHRRWLGIVIKGRGIIITPLQNVGEFQEEGKAMHHCVFANAYYKKRDSLIMSARDNEGKRLATIEYDTKNGRLLQCRSACNGRPEKYNQIVALVRRHAGDFKKESVQP